MGLFNIFSKKQKRLTTPVDLSIVGCDIHSHFIPGIDDGAKTLEESVQMISELYKLGYKKIITSPHTYMNPPDNLFHVIFKMQLLGYKPILAHPERYNFWHKDFEKYEAFIDKGVLLQLNINSLTGYYSLDTKKIAEQMIDKNMISFLGTDCHHMGHINLIKEAIYEPYLQKLTESGMLQNKNLLR